MNTFFNYRYLIEVSDTEYVRTMPGHGFAISSKIKQFMCVDESTAIQLAEEFNARKVTRGKSVNFSPSFIETVVIWDKTNNNNTL